VRSLAQRSSQAAKDIKDLITNSSGQVRQGVELVNRAGGALTEIVDSIKKVVDVVSQIAAASAEQSTGIDQVNTALTQMDEVTQQNSALVEENAATAKTLEQQSAAMNERVGAFKLMSSAGEGGRRPAAEFKRSAPPSRQAAPARRAVAGGRAQGALAVKDDAEF
jgi:methyl-accepting chemotaxis protein